MIPSEIARRRRALADEIERKVDLGAPAVKPAAGLIAEADADGAEVFEVKYWEVRTSAKGTIMASLGVDVDGEKVYWKCFDADLIAKIDPLKRGDRVAVKTAPWNDTRKVVGIERVAGGVYTPARPPARKPSGMSSEEIPF